MMTCILVRGRQREVQRTHRGESYVNTEQRLQDAGLADWSDDLRPREVGSHRKLEVTRSRLVPKSSAAGTADTWISALRYRFQTSGLQRRYISVVFSLPVDSDLLEQSQRSVSIFGLNERDTFILFLLKWVHAAP